MSQYSDPDSTRMEPAVEYDEGVMEDRDAVRKGVWYQALGIVEYMRNERLPKEDQRVQKRLDLRMPFLGEQPLEEWVNKLEHLVRQEMWLEDAYQALWWYWARYLPWTPELDKPEGEEFDGPGLLWETFSELEFGSPTQARFRDLFEWRESLYDWDDTHKIEQDLVYLVTREMELEQDYQQLFHSSAKTQQESRVTDLEPFSWEDIVEVYWEEPQVAGGDGTEVSLPVLQGCWAVGPDPQRQYDMPGIESPVSFPQQQSVFLGEENLVLPLQRLEVCMGEELVTPSPQRQLDVPRGDCKPHNSADGTVVSALAPQGAETVGSVPQQQSVLLGEENLVLPLQRLEVCMGEELVTPSPQRQLDVPRGDCKPHNSADGTVVSALAPQGVETVGPPQQQGCVSKGEIVGLPLQQQGCVSKGETIGRPLQQPGSNQATSVVVRASGQSTADLYPLSNPPRPPSSTPHSCGEAPGHGQATHLPRCSNHYWWVSCTAVSVLWMGCWTNQGTDRQEVRHPVSLFGKGERCDETNLATVHWRSLVASLLAHDYGPKIHCHLFGHIGF